MMEFWRQFVLEMSIIWQPKTILLISEESRCLPVKTIMSKQYNTYNGKNIKTDRCCVWTARTTSATVWLLHSRVWCNTKELLCRFVIINETSMHLQTRVEETVKIVYRAYRICCEEGENSPSGLKETGNRFWGHSKKCVWGENLS